MNWVREYGITHLLLIIGDLFWKILDAIDALADLQENLRKKVSEGEESFYA